MQETVVFKFEVFDESIKQKAMIVIWTCPGVKSNVDVKEGGIVKVTGEFDKHEMLEKLKEIDEHVDIIEEAEPEVNKQKEDKRPLKNQQVTTQPPDGAGSSTWQVPYQLLDRAKGVVAGVKGLVYQEPQMKGRGKPAVVAKPVKKAKVNNPQPMGRGRAFNNGYEEPKKPELLKKVVDGAVHLVGLFDREKAKKAKQEADLNAKRNMCVIMGPNGKEKKNKNKHKNVEPSKASSSARPNHNPEIQGLGQGFTESWMYTNMTSALSTILPTTSTGDQPSTETRKKESGSDAKKGRKEDPKKPPRK